MDLRKLRGENFFRFTRPGQLQSGHCLVLRVALDARDQVVQVREIVFLFASFFLDGWPDRLVLIRDVTVSSASCPGFSFQPRLEPFDRHLWRAIRGLHVAFLDGQQRAASIQPH
ncbi:hypothetical protein EBZ80_06810 [bacterium]|nr:hypothetical protein [bacterium]